MSGMFRASNGRVIETVQTTLAIHGPMSVVTLSPDDVAAFTEYLQTAPANPWDTVTAPAVWWFANSDGEDLAGFDGREWFWVRNRRPVNFAHVTTGRPAT